MGNIYTLFTAIFLISALLFHVSSLASVVSTGDFNKDFFVIWAAPGHVNTSADGRSTSLTLDTVSSSSMSTKDKYLFGQFVMKMKLVPGDSAGTVSAFYVSVLCLITNFCFILLVMYVSLISSIQISLTG
nr:probable xyloglucan endotransglucosylase/hydrolase protein 10 [Ipomoea batatas]